MCAKSIPHRTLRAQATVPALVFFAHLCAVLPATAQTTFALRWESIADHGPVGEVPLTITPLGYYTEPRLDGINKVAIDYGGPLNPATVVPDIVSIEGRTLGDVPVDLTGHAISVSLTENDTRLIVEFSPKLPGSNPDEPPVCYFMRVFGLRDINDRTVPNFNSVRIFRAQLGDVNGDAVVNTSDMNGARTARDMLNGAMIDPMMAGPLGFMQVRSDVNTDGRANTSDMNGVRTARDDSAPNDSRSINCIDAPPDSVLDDGDGLAQCPPVTKATFEIWNSNEDFFSGTDRCIESWDQRLLSDYTLSSVPNQFLRSQLHTDVGNARITGTASTVCEAPFCCERGDDDCQADFAFQHDGLRAPLCSEAIPLLGVAAKQMHFPDRVELAGSHLTGTGFANGRIHYTRVSESEQATAAPDTPANPGQAGEANADGPLAGEVPGETTQMTCRAGTSTKGSLLVFPNIELKWDGMGNFFQDTFITLTNDSDSDVRVKLYFVDGDGCQWFDNAITLTGHESAHWSLLTGDPKGLSSFSGLGLGVADPDYPEDAGVSRLSGYLLAWAVDHDHEGEIRWNHLTGSAMQVDYQATAAWEYSPWAFPAVAGTADGEDLLDPLGQLDLDGVEYANVPATMLLQFWAPGAVMHTPGVGQAELDTDLTLWAAFKDLREPE